MVLLLPRRLRSNYQQTGTVLAGIALIIAGVVTVELGSQHAANKTRLPD